MKFNHKLFITGLVLVGSVAQANDRQLKWLAPEARDFTPSLMLATGKAQTLQSVHSARESVHFTWPLSGHETLVPPEALRNESRAFWLDVSSQALAAGVRLPLTAAGAIVRISPATDDKVLISAADVRVEAKGAWYAGDQALERFVDGEALKAAGLPVTAHTVAFSLRRDLGAESVLLAVPLLANAKGQYLIHVFEPESAVALQLSSARLDFALGEVVSLQVETQGIAAPLMARDLTGYLASPDGSQTVPLKFSRDANGMLTAMVETAGMAASPGLFEARVFLEKRAAVTVLRDITIPLGLAPITAVIDSRATLVNGGDTGSSFAVDVGVDVAVAGRFELSGVLYADGEPLAMMTSAAWLEFGARSLRLTVEAKHLSEVGPFTELEIRQLVLKDQSRLGVLWRQQRGLSITLANEP